MRDSVPSPRYSAICNVLRQWKTSLIPTYRVYRLYDYALRAQIVNGESSRPAPVISGVPQGSVLVLKFTSMTSQRSTSVKVPDLLKI